MALEDKQYNERVKLRAASLNAIALGIFVLGLARPILTAYLEETDFDFSVFIDWRYLIVAIVSVFLHSLALQTYSNLVEET